MDELEQLYCGSLPGKCLVALCTLASKLALKIIDGLLKIGQRAVGRLIGDLVRPCSAVDYTRVADRYTVLCNRGTPLKTSRQALRSW